MSEANKERVVGRPIRILFVEDEADERALTCAQLGREGFDVVEAANGRVALLLFGETSFDVVVTDIFMPDEDGIELIQDLRRRRPQLPIVAITGGGTHHDTSALRVAAALGAGALLLKPFRVSELVAAIHRVLE